MLNLKIEKKSFRNFQPVESGLVSEQKSFFSRFFRFFKLSTGFDWLKLPKRLFSIFKLSTGKKSIECDVSELLEAKYGHSKPVFCLYILKRLKMSKKGASKKKPGFDRLKIPKRLFFRFQIEHQKKTYRIRCPRASGSKMRPF